MRYLAGLFLVGVLAAAGCTPEQHQDYSGSFKQIQVEMEGVKNALGSQTAKTVTGVIASLPTPLAPIVEPARTGLEWGAGIVATLAGLVAAWQAKRAKDEKTKKRVYKAALPKAALNEANKTIYGSDFKASLSK